MKRLLLRILGAAGELGSRRPVQAAAAALVLAAPSVWLLTLVAAPEEALRVRTALVADVGGPSDFDWLPGDAPATFRLDSGDVPADFLAYRDGTVSGALRGATDIESALSISRHLMTASSRSDGPIQENLLPTFREIVESGEGYCVDFARVFNGLALSIGLPVRQWGFSFSAFGSGHTFNEVFDRQLGQWVLVDSFHSLLFVDPATRRPLSVLELHDRLLALNGQPDAVAIEKIVPAAFPFRSDALALDYYRRGMSQLYLVWGNDVFDYERTAASWIEASISRPLGQFIGIASGDYPRIRVYPHGLSERDAAELSYRERAFKLALMLFFICAVFAFFLLAAATRRRAQGTP